MQVLNSFRFLFGIFFSLFFNLLPACFAQGIQWSAKSPLSVSDFKGKPDTSVPYLAVTYSRIGQKMALKNGILSIEVTHVFDPDRLWMKKEHAVSALLEHEQLHFTLSEVYARRIQQQLRNLIPTQKLQETIRSIVQKELNSMNARQDAYDRETNHGTKRSEQEQWKRTIEDMIRQTPDALQPFELTGF